MLTRGVAVAQLTREQLLERRDSCTPFAYYTDADWKALAAEFDRVVDEIKQRTPQAPTPDDDDDDDELMHST